MNREPRQRKWGWLRHVAWVLLIATILWGVYAYERMPKRKDPLIATRFAVAVCSWPGASSERIEELSRRVDNAKEYL